MEQNYEDLLEKGYSELPEILKETKRFEIPEVSSMIQGKITVIQNFGELAKLISREPDMLTKYLLKEFGTSGNQDGQQLVMKGQFRKFQIQEKYEAFLKQYVICPECNRPDTKLVKEDRVTFLKCEACGSRHPLAMIKVVSQEKKPELPKTGDIITLNITRTGKKGDGMGKFDRYTVFVKGARQGQKVKAVIRSVQGTMIFSDVVEILQ